MLEFILSLEESQDYPALHLASLPADERAAAINRSFALAQDENFEIFEANDVEDCNADD